MKSQKKAKSTLEQYGYDCRFFLTWNYKYNEDKNILDLRKRDFRNFFLWCDENQMSGARRNRILSVIHMLTEFLENDEDEYEEYERSASAKIKGVERGKVRTILFIENDIIQKLYDKFMKEERYRDATLLAILYESGCRRNEICQVRRDSITQEGNATNEVTGKRGKKFKVLYFSHTKEAFKKYEETRTDNCEMLFTMKDDEPADGPALYRWVSAWIKDLEEIDPDRDYDALNVHSFRHCFIESLCRGTHWICKEMKLGKVPIEKVKVLAHHSDISVTDSYRDNNEERDIEELFGFKLS